MTVGPQAVSPAHAGPTGLGWLRALPRRTLASRSLFGLLVLVNLVIGAVCAIQALSWIDKPFPGFLVNERLVAAGVGRYGWTGTAAGLKYPDKILTANGEPLTHPAQLERIAEAVPVGEPITYTVQRGERVIELTIPTMRFGLADFLANFGSLWLVGVIYLSLGVVVFVLKPDTAVSWAFFVACFFLGSFNLVGFDVAATHAGFVRWYLLSLAFMAAAGVHLSMLFPEPWKSTGRRPWLQVLPYGLALLIVAPLEWLYPQPGFMTFYRLLYLYLIVAAATLAFSSFGAYWRTSSFIARQRSKVVLFGAALAFPIPALGQLAMFSGTTFGGFQVQTNYLPIFATLFPASIAYAISKHNLFDVDVYIKRTVGYVIMTAIVGFAYFTVQTGLSTFVLQPAFGDQAEAVYPIVFALLVVFFFNPVNSRVQAAVERLFFRKAYDYKETVGSIGDALGRLFDLNAFLEHALGTVKNALFLDRAGVILLDDRQRVSATRFLADPSDRRAAAASEGSAAAADPLLALLAREKKLITKYDIAEDPDYAAVREPCAQRFEELGASLAFPLFTEEHFTGALALGYKKSGRFYSREDVDLLGTVSAMTSTAVEQAQEKAQRGTLMQLFSKHVSPEVAESLWEQREQFLDGGRPRSQKLTVTAMFTDLAGFSSVSERFDPDTLMDWLNTYMDAITRIVMEYGGVVDDYFGDGVKVNFGVPIPRTSDDEIRDDAIHAVDCALALEAELIRQNAVMEKRGMPTLRMRVGIFTGPVVAGSLGSSDRQKYTTLGDTVNTAARLEQYDKGLTLPHLETSPCRILVGDSTLELLGDRYETVRVGEMALKGKQKPVVAHCVIRRKGGPGGGPERPGARYGRPADALGGASG